MHVFAAPVDLESDTTESSDDGEEQEGGEQEADEDDDNDDDENEEDVERELPVMAKRPDDPLFYDGLYAPSGFDMMSILVRNFSSFCYAAQLLLTGLTDSRNDSSKQDYRHRSGGL